MKLAVISDIHSNVYALEAVLNDIAKRGADRIVNLGDTLYGPIAPKATYNLITSSDVTSICGNQDRMLHEVTHKEFAANPTLQFVLGDLGNAPIDWLKTLPFDCQVNRQIYACHGSPTNDLTYLMEDVSSGEARVRSDSEILQLVDGQNSSVILCGHTHIPRVVELSTGQLIVNAGSVGLPAFTDDQPTVHSMETYSSHASYTMLETNSDGWNIQQMKIPYPVQDAVNAAAKQGRSDWAHYLATGRINEL
ncbi:metallophosphoesterase family protein [Halodesulfovibrio marinisediminis]|uniref:Predicted phosphodiesterase n=1 Tax=Halodesulfovibrio marinisediminis DSM 17456 TaxID=1121457 RepID=A0A1N6FGU0_9BACT|nr:metallophosphoesterase family protein [Halodesulfovibrio marinisediminis]SIN94465.1 Predicted phosphodiesterase [Halodesulfovibrio marinisediminis DSM 17456]